MLDSKGVEWLPVRVIAARLDRKVSFVSQHLKKNGLRTFRLFKKDFYPFEEAKPIIRRIRRARRVR